MPDGTLRLYDEFASWYHLLTAPAEYVEEAEFYRQILVDASATPIQTLLELGSGGGNMASHYKRYFQSTLVDLSPQMLAISRTINPECEHFQGDMRFVRLGRVFDAVFVHDAIMYMTTADDLRKAMETAFVHCRPGGIAVFAPDYVRETFIPGTDHGGNDEAERCLRYLEWRTDPDPTDTAYQVDYAYLYREAGGPTQIAYDQHIEGLFSQEVWLELLTDLGFQAVCRTGTLADSEHDYRLFVALRPEAASRRA
ncbi:MAG: class I SAM-dependent DNA methyltransferase [Dehalococcoidia bacterium]